MEDFTFTTGTMSLYEANKFLKWFDHEIGTDHEIDRDGDEYTLTFFSLNEEELEKVSVYEFTRKNGDITLEASE